MITSETEISATLDWMSLTIEKPIYPDHWTTVYTEMNHGMNHYDMGKKYADGRIELCSSSRPDMMTHIIFNGDTLRHLQDAHGDTLEGIIAFYQTARFSRIDLAVDVRHGSLDIADLRDKFGAGEGGSRAKTGLHLEGVGQDGETLYIGAPKSGKRLRIYDKKAEAGTDYEWTRIELQMRSKTATRTVATLIGGENLGGTIAAVVRDFASFPSSAEWLLALGHDEIKIAPGEKGVSARLNWLMTTAARALAHEVVDNADNDIAVRFIDSFLSFKHDFETRLKK